MGLHDARSRSDRRSRPAHAARSRAIVAPRLHRRPLRHARRVLPCRSARIHRRVAVEHRRQPGRHLRTNRTDRTAAARGADWSTRSISTSDPVTSGAWMNGSTSSTGREVRPDASAQLRARRSRTLFQSHQPRSLRMPDCASAFPEGRHELPTESPGTPASAAP